MGQFTTNILGSTALSEVCDPQLLPFVTLISTESADLWLPARTARKRRLVY